MKIFMEITNKSTRMAEQNSQMSLSIYHQNLTIKRIETQN